MASPLSAFDQSCHPKIDDVNDERRKSMKVADIMTKSPVYCSPETNLAAAVEILWNRNCGILPVVDSNQKLVGVATDRDICVALGTRNRLPSEITIKDVTSRKVVACKPDDDLRRALAAMAEARVRRLPVTDSTGKLQGILSMDDIVLHTETGGVKHDTEISPEDVVNTLKSVYAPQPRRAGQQKAAAA
jgi:CBS domain-containing protein